MPSSAHTNRTPYWPAIATMASGKAAPALAKHIERLMAGREHNQHARGRVCCVSESVRDVAGQSHACPRARRGFRSLRDHDEFALEEVEEFVVRLMHLGRDAVAGCHQLFAHYEGRNGSVREDGQWRAKHVKVLGIRGRLKRLSADLVKHFLVPTTTLNRVA